MCLHSSVTLTVLLALFQGASEAFAQDQRQPAAYPVVNRLGVAAAIGISNTGDRNKSHAGRDLVLALRAPVRRDWSVYVDYGKARWTFDAYSPLSLPRRDTVGLQRLTVSIVRRDPDVSMFYAGGGAGMYRYSARVGEIQPASRFGAHGRAGIEIPMPSDVGALLGEVQVHAVRGPRAEALGNSPVFSELLWIIGASIGFRFNLR